MRRIRIAVLLLSAMSFTLSLAHGAGRSPWPDSEERAAFQREELRRRALVGRFRPAETERVELQDGYDAIHYRLALDLRDPEAAWILGDLEADLLVVDDSLETILLDLNEVLEVDSVFVDGTRAGFVHEVYDLRIDPGRVLARGERVRVRVFYQGHPIETGFYAFGWGSHDGTPLIWSLSEPRGAREWWPCKDRPDDKADSLDVWLRVDDWMVATSNGLLVEQIDLGDGSRSFHWKHRYPITTYLVSVTATNYERLTGAYVSAEGDSMLIEHFVYPEHVVPAQEDFSITNEAIDAMSARFGPYPFLREKYGHTIFPFYGGMEHQTNTSYGANLITGQHLYDWILVHELAHQWWGDKTSPADWRDIWLNEGFASFCEALWFEEKGGFADYQAFMTNIQVVGDPSGPLYDPPALFDGNTVYNKGAWALHMLRGVLGDSLFYAAFNEYGSRTAYRSTTTAEFQAIVEEVARTDLDWFFEPWIYGTDRPHYEVSFLSIGEPGLPAVAIHLGQTQEEPAYFPMPVDLEIELEGGGFVRERVWNDPDHEDFEFDLPLPPARVMLDPDDWILRAQTTAAYAMHITTTDLPSGTEDSTYEASLRARGGAPPYQWSPLDSLPQGIALDPGAGILSGIAPVEGTYSFRVSLIDAGDLVDTQSYRWTVEASTDTSIVEPPDTTVVETTGRLSLQVGPVPAHQWVTFEVEDPNEEPVTLTLYDLQGRRVRDLWDGPAPGRAITWDGYDGSGRRVASGLYIARLRSPTGAVSRRVVWLRAR